MLSEDLSLVAHSIPCGLLTIIMLSSSYNTGIVGFVLLNSYMSTISPLFNAIFSFLSLHYWQIYFMLLIQSHPKTVYKSENSLDSKKITGNNHKEFWKTLGSESSSSKISKEYLKMS